MKAILIADTDAPNPEFKHEDSVRARQEGLPYRVPHSIILPKGTEIEGREVWKLVVMGQAEPGDDECAIAAGMTAEQMKAAQAGRVRTEETDLGDKRRKAA